MVDISHPLCDHNAEPYRWNSDLQQWEFWWNDIWNQSSIYTHIHNRPDANSIYDRVVISYELTWAEPVKLDE